MPGPNLPEVPAPLKPIQHYLKIASTHDQRDPVVSYWCRLYALQTGLTLSTKTPEESNFLLKLMQWLEDTKKEMHDNEAITNDVAAQAHLENWALKLFLHADKNDRASNFGKSVVQSFFTAGLLYDVLTVFGKLSEEATQNRKYAKWKAAYIHNCLKNGETPIPGPVKDPEEDDNPENDESEELHDTGPSPASRPGNVTTPDSNESISVDNDPYGTPQKPPGNTGIPVTPTFPSDYTTVAKVDGDVSLTLDQMGKAQKFIKWAGSALNYDDVPTAVVNLRKALHLLTTGQEPT